MADKVTINSAFEIEGSEDTTQLRVSGNSTQNAALQSWEDDGGAIAEVAADGRLRVGNLADMGTPDALIEANDDIDLPSSRPLRGLQSLGQIGGAVSSAIIWLANELHLNDAGGVSGLQTALRSIMRIANTGDVDQAEVRAGDLQVINETGTAAKPLGQLTGLRAEASNEAGAYVSSAAGVAATISNDTGGDMESASAFAVAAPVNNGTIDTLYGLRIPDLDQGTVNYAIHTGTGPVHHGDYVELAGLSSTPATPGTDAVRLYAKDGDLYYLNDGGTEIGPLGTGGGGSGSGLTVTKEAHYVSKLIYDDKLSSAGRWDVDLTDIGGEDYSTGYDHLELIMTARSSESTTSDVVEMFFNNDTTDTNYRWLQHYGTNSSNGASANDQAVIGSVPGASGTSNYFGIIRVILPEYASTNLNKISSVFSTERRDVTSVVVKHIIHHWESTNAVTRITIQPDGYSTDNFVANSRLQIIAHRQQQVVTDVSGGQGTLFSSTATATVSNTTTETSLIGTGSGNLQLAADLLTAGKVIRVLLHGYLSTIASPGTLNVKLKLGSTEVCSTGTVTPNSSLNNAYFRAAFEIVCRTTGASGTVVAGGRFEHDDGSGFAALKTTTTTIDTTGAQTVDVTATWGTADVGNTISSQIVTVEELN